MSLAHTLAKAYEKLGGDLTRLPNGIRDYFVARELYNAVKGNSASSSYGVWTRGLASTLAFLSFLTSLPAIVYAQEKPSDFATTVL